MGPGAAAGAGIYPPGRRTVAPPAVRSPSTARAGARRLGALVPSPFAAAVFFPQLASAADVLFLLGLQLVALLCIARRQLDGFLGLAAGLELAAALSFGVELGTDQQRHVQDPQPEQGDDDAADRAVGLVVAVGVRHVEAEGQGSQLVYG